MTFQFGDPPDPVYVAFRTGLHEYFDRWDTRAPVRWAFFRKDWRSYPRDRFSLAETPVAATDPGMAIDPKLDFGPPLRNYLEVHDFELAESLPAASRDVRPV